jgi:hypothetical protein
MHRAVAADERDPDVAPLKQPLAALQNLVEHRLRVCHRARDYLQHLGGGLELVERFLRLVEEPHVRDRDRGLVGEGLQQRALSVAERPDVPSKHGNHAKHGVAAEQRRSHDAVIAVDAPMRPAYRILLLGFQGEVGNTNGRPLDDCPAGRRASRDGDGEVRSEPLAERSAALHGAQHIALVHHDHHVVRVAEARRVLGNCVEHRRNVGRRAADHAQDLGGRSLPLERFLRLVEEPRVLDRDHRLIGERLQQRDLLLGELAHDVAADEDHADASTLP